MSFPAATLYRSQLELVFGAIVLLAGCATVSDIFSSTDFKLEGSQEVPPVTTSASGRGDIKVAADRTVSGNISVSGIAVTAAHIHIGAAGKNGAIIIPLAKTSDTDFAVPASKKLTAAQFQAYKAGQLYVNVHSAKHPGGEIRAQIVPAK